MAGWVMRVGRVQPSCGVRRSQWNGSVRGVLLSFPRAPGCFTAG